MDKDDVSDIMVVDDAPDNLRVLSGMLKQKGYRVRPVPSGELALRAAANSPPDLILLDISMPDMNGYEVCRRLKADPNLKDIPVLFISALSDTTDKVDAFSAGGVDFVGKPFQFPEVEARVEVHLELRRLQRDVTRKNRELEKTVTKLNALEQLRDNLVHMIVHDMRSPLTAVTNWLRLLKIDFNGEAAEKCNRDIEKALGGGRRLTQMVDDLLDISRFEAGAMPQKPAKCDLVALARQAVGTIVGMEPDRIVNIDAPETLEITCDPDLIGRVIENLVSNGFKHTPAGSRLDVALVPEGCGARVAVRDKGEGLPPEYHEKIFEKFGQVEIHGERRYHSTGLGLTFCKLAVESHGGQIGVESAVGAGSTFWFTLPGSVDTAARDPESK